MFLTTKCQLVKKTKKCQLNQKNRKCPLVIQHAYGTSPFCKFRKTSYIDHLSLWHMVFHNCLIAGIQRVSCHTMGFSKKTHGEMLRATKTWLLWPLICTLPLGSSVADYVQHSCRCGWLWKTLGTARKRNTFQAQIWISQDFPGHRSIKMGIHHENSGSHNKPWKYMEYGGLSWFLPHVWVEKR